MRNAVTALSLACLLASGCASQPRDASVLAYCSSSMLSQGRIQVGLFDSRIPCIIDERKPKSGGRNG